MDADPFGRSLARIHASPASWCGCRRSLSPGARQSIRCLAPTHVDANAAQPLGSKRESTASSAISGKSPMCASPRVPSPFFCGTATARSIGTYVGARGRSRSSAPRRDPVVPPRLASWISHPTTPQKPARVAMWDDRDPATRPSRTARGRTPRPPRRAFAHPWAPDGILSSTVSPASRGKRARPPVATRSGRRDPRRRGRRRTRRGCLAATRGAPACRRGTPTRIAAPRRARGSLTSLRGTRDRDASRCSGARARARLGVRPRSSRRGHPRGTAPGPRRCSGRPRRRRRRHRRTSHVA